MSALPVDEITRCPERSCTCKETRWRALQVLICVRECAFTGQHSFNVMNKPVLTTVRKKNLSWDDMRKKPRRERGPILVWVTQWESGDINHHHYCFALNDCRLRHHPLTAGSLFRLLWLQMLWERTSSQWPIALKPDWHSIGNFYQKGGWGDSSVFLCPLIYCLCVHEAKKKKRRLDLSFCFIFCCLQPHRRAWRLVSFARRWEAMPETLFVCLSFHLHLAEICLTVRQSCFPPQGFGIR